MFMVFPTCSPPLRFGVEGEASRLGHQGERSNRVSSRETKMAAKAEGSSLNSPLPNDASTCGETIPQERRIPTPNSFYEGRLYGGERFLLCGTRGQPWAHQ